MKRIVVFVVAIINLLPVLVSAAMTNQLEAAYKEQYERYNKEEKVLQPIVADYEKCINGDDNISTQLTDLKGKYALYQISKKEFIDEQLNLLYKRQDLLAQCIKTLNLSKGGHRTDFSIHELKEDMEASRRRIKELIDKKQELKIKILEVNGILPVWWVN